MAYFVRKCSIFLSIASLFILLFLLPPRSSAAAQQPDYGYHNGPILTGQINLAFLWYGKFFQRQKYLINTFIQSLHANETVINYEPRLSKWWAMVQKYQTLTDNKKVLDNDKIPEINVEVVSQVMDDKFSIGNKLDDHSIEYLVQKAVDGMPKNIVRDKGTASTVAVLFISDDVAIGNSCPNPCYSHGVTGKQLYMMVKNPRKDCLRTCAWPYHRTRPWKLDIVLQPANGNAGTDVMIIHFAAALASTVTNPYGNGFYLPGAVSPKQQSLEVGSACEKVFGSNAFQGFTGRVHIDPTSGGAFNAHGLNNTKFLLPGVWNAQHLSCWTLM